MIPRTSAAPILAAAATLAAPAAADDAEGDPLRLTLGAAEERALERSREVRIAREEIRRAESQITQVRADALPQVTGNVRYERTLRSVFDVDGDAPPGLDPDEFLGDLPFGQENTWNFSIGVNQAIYSGGRVSTGLDIAERVRAASHHGLEEAEFEVVRDVREAYLQAILARAFVDIAEEAYDIAEEQLELVESFAARGAATDLEVLQARVERDNIEPEVVQAENTSRLAELELRRLLAIPRDRPIELADDLAEPDRVLAVDDERVLRAALRRPATRAAREQVRISEEAIELARAGRMPTVSAFANFSWQTFPENIVPTTAPWGEEWREDWILGMQVEIPIFQGFRVSGEIDEARAERRAAVLEERLLREGVTLEAESALSDLEAAEARIQARRGTVEEAERALELAELRYEQGMARLVELSSARLMLQQARANEAEARVEYLSALAALEYITGGDLDLFDSL